MTKHLRLAPVLLAAAFLAGCQGPCDKLSPIRVAAPTVSGGAANFTTYAAVGTSISAGYQSGGLVDRHQVDAFTAIFARQIGRTVQLDGRGGFSEPTVNGNGLHALLQLRSVNPLIITNEGLADGSPTNLAYPAPYRNMGVPGAILYDFANTTRYASGAFPLVTRGLGSIQNQMLSLNPTFITFEFGANEVLGPATSGTSTQAPGTDPASYAAMLTGAMNAIHTAAPGATLAIFNVPDVVGFPFFTTLKPYTIMLATGQPTTLVGPNGPLAPTDLVLLTAADSLATGTGFPVGSYNYIAPSVPGNGRPLLDSQVLDTSEASAIESDITAMNAVVDSVSQRPWIAEVDLNGLLATLAARDTTIGPTTYSTAYVTGGLFSLDGVHPTDLAHALIANTMIDAVNAKFGSTVPEAYPLTYATATASSAMPAPAGEGALRNMRVTGLRESLKRLFGR